MILFLILGVLVLWLLVHLLIRSGRVVLALLLLPILGALVMALLHSSHLLR